MRVSILAVEDEDTRYENLESILKAISNEDKVTWGIEGFDFKRAISADRALALLEKSANGSPYDLLVLDLRIPEDLGGEVTSTGGTSSWSPSDHAFLEPEVYDRYRVPLPNGILFFGPPGCGKTFIARKFAGMLSFNFLELKPSDLASIYVHGRKGK